MIIKRKRKPNFIGWLLGPLWGLDSTHRRPDFVLLIVVGLILFLGLVFLSSASSTLGYLRFDDAYRFVKQQLTHGILPGLAAFLIFIRIPYTFYKKFTWIWLIFSLILLIVVLISGNQYGSAQSWINFGGFSFQPSELVKLFFILFLAGWLTSQGDQIKDFKRGLIPFVIFLSLVCLLLMLQPDLGTFGIIAFVSLAMFFAAGARFWHLLTLIGAGLGAFGAIILAAPYRLNRISAWLNPDIDPQGISWQVKQSLIAIGSGGWFGEGLGASRQKSYLPQAANDSIFAIVAEEIGFVFTFLFLILFIILVQRGFRLIKKTPDKYAQLIVLGIIVMLAFQFFVNIAGMLALVPLTGVPLPFVSLGGSNMIIGLISIGILANISKCSKN